MGQCRRKSGGSGSTGIAFHEQTRKPSPVFESLSWELQAVLVNARWAFLRGGLKHVPAASVAHQSLAPSRDVTGFWRQTCMIQERTATATSASSASGQSQLPPGHRPQLQQSTVDDIHGASTLQRGRDV